MKKEDIVMLVLGISLGVLTGIIGAAIGVLSTKDKIKHKKVIKNLSWTSVIVGLVSICTTFVLSSFQIVSFNNFISIFWVALVTIFIGGWPLFFGPKPDNKTGEDKENK